MVVMFQKSLGLDDAEVYTVEEKDYRTHFWNISEAEAMSRMKKTDIKEKISELCLWRNQIICILL